MSIRKKTVLLFTITLFGLIIVLYAALSNILLSGFIRLEEQDTRENVARVREALNAEVAALNLTSQDWAEWDDTYNFVVDGNVNYRTSNLNDASLAILRVNFFLLLNNSGNIVFGTGFDLVNRVPQPLPQSLEKFLEPTSLLLTRNGPENILSGLLDLPESPTLIVARPILTSHGDWPIHGTLIMGRYLDATATKRLSDRTRLAVDIFSVNRGNLPGEVQAVRGSLAALQDQDSLVRPLNEQSVAGYSVWRDIYGNPGIVLRVVGPRDNYTQGQTSLRYLVACLLIVGLVFGLVIWFLLQKSILDRLAKLKNEVSKVGSMTGLAGRVAITGNDEVAAFAGAINQTLAALELSQLEQEESEERYRQLVELSPDAIIVSSEGRIVFINSAGVHMLAAGSGDELLGRPMLDFVEPAYAKIMEEEIALAQENVMPCCLFQGRLTRLNGEIIDFEMAVVAVTHLGQPAAQIILRDITERKQAETALQRYQLLSEHASEIILFIRADGSILEGNRAAIQTYGYTLEELLNLNIRDLRAPDLLHLVPSQLQQAYRKGIFFETVHRHKNGSTFPVEVSSESIELGDEYILLSIIRDISDRKRFEDLLHHQAFHDALTGLPNRQFFSDRLSFAFEQARQDLNYTFAVLFLDLDRFKVINDSLGHALGDQLLILAAQNLKECLRPADIVARLGGDEFTVLLEGIKEPSDATQVAERILEALTKPLKLDGHEIFSSVSIGIALSSVSYTNPEEMLRDADTAMYYAKTLGKGRYEVFTPAMHTSVLAQLQLDTELRRALDNLEFRVHYQPIVAIQSGETVGFEALLRWQHPNRELILPAEFLAAAEETGLIVPIGKWILKEACRQLRFWQHRFPANPPLWMDINLSSRQFAQPGLVEQIESILKETGLKADCLHLEITEQVIMNNSKETMARLLKLKELGIELYMDDFGTGYSSLSYLHLFPLDALKIERSFIERLGSGEEKLDIVRAIITLAHNLKLVVIAKGVETEEQLGILRGLGCDYAQGFLFSRPVEASQLEKEIGAVRKSYVALG